MKVHGVKGAANRSPLLLCLLSLIGFVALRYLGNRRRLEIDPYWAWHWRMDYTFGFARRSLLGAVFYPLIAGSHDGTIIRAIGFVIAACLALLISFRLSQRVPRAWVLLAWAPPICGVIFECLGDPVQLLLLLFLLLSSILFRDSERRSSWGALVLTGLVGFLFSCVHEANFFFTVAPVFSFWLLASESQRAKFRNGLFWAFGSGSVLGILFVTFAATPVPVWQQKASFFSLHFPNGKLVHLTPFLFPNLATLINDEKVNHFGAHPHLPQIGFGVVRIVVYAVSAAIFPIAILLFIRAFNKASVAAKKGVNLARWYALSVLLSLPLYVIAHDWGRFMGYTLCALIGLTPLYAGDESVNFEGLSTPVRGGLILVLIGCLSGPFLDYYRINGLTSQPRAFCLAAAAATLAGIALLLRRRRSSLELSL